MTISAKLLALAATKEGIRSVLDIGADVPFSQYPALVQAALENVVVPDPEPVVPEGNEYIEVIGHADGGLTYKATELALAGNSYELNGEWYYIVKDHPDLYEKILLWDLPEFAGNSSQEVEVAALNGTHLMTADRLVTSKITASIGWDVYPELSIPEEDWVDGEEPEPRVPEFFNQRIGSWDTSNMVSMEMFLFAMKSFDQPIGNWDVSKVTDFSRLFSFASAFNQPIGRWDVSNGVLFDSTFASAISFNQDISGWNVSSATTLSYCFSQASAFNQDIGGWDVSSVVDFDYCFAFAETFNQDISQWDVSSAFSMEAMFSGMGYFDQDLSSWCVSNIATVPDNFSLQSNSWLLPKPVWGTCPER